MEDRQLGLLTFLQIWRDLFLGVSLAFVVIHSGAETGARWMFCSEDSCSEMVDLSLSLDFVDGICQILVQDSTGMFPVHVSL
jgi:hypothetical protein